MAPTGTAIFVRVGNCAAAMSARADLMVCRHRQQRRRRRRRREARHEPASPARARLQRERATARKARQAVAAYREQLAAWEQHLRERERYLTRQLPHLSQPGRAASRRRPQHDMGWAGLHAGSEPRPMASTLPAPFPETGTGGGDDQAPTERVEIPAPVQWCRKGETTNERNG